MSARDHGPLLTSVSTLTHMTGSPWAAAIISWIRAAMPTGDPTATFAADTAKRVIPSAFYGAWGSSYPDPLQMFQTIVLGGTTGFSWYNNSAVNTLINQASVATDNQSYVSELRQIQTDISTGAPFIYLFAYEDAWGITKGLNWTPLSTEVENFYYASW